MHGKNTVFKYTQYYVSFATKVVLITAQVH